MNECDFKQLKALKTPEKWIENALNIPKKKNKPLPLFLRPSFIGSAAALAVLVAVMITLRLQAGAPPLTDMSGGIAAVPSATQSSGQPEATSEPPSGASSAAAITESFPPSVNQPSNPSGSYEALSGGEAAFSTEAAPNSPNATSAASSSSTEQPTREHTDPSAKPPVQTPAELPSLPPVQAPTQSVTQPLTEPVIQPATEALTSPFEEYDPDATSPVPGTLPENPGEPFYGSLQFKIIDSSLLFGSNSIRVAFFTTDGSPVGVPKSFRPALTEEGVKTAVMYPHLQNIPLTCGNVYTMQITGSKGVSESLALVVKNSASLDVYV